MRSDVWPDKFRKFSFISKEIREEDGAWVDAGFLLPAFGLGVGICLPAEGEEPAEIGEGGFYHGLTDAGFTAEQEIENAEKVGDEAQGDDGQGVEEGEVAGEEDIVIAEGQEGLQVVLPGEGSAAFVVDNGRWAGVDGIAHVADAPAKVDVFLVHIVEVIEAAGLMEEFGRKAHAGAGGPENFYGVVVLAGILLDRGEDAASGEGKAKAVDPAAGSAGVFEVIAAIEGPKLRLTDTDPGVGFEEVDQGFDKAGRNFDIRIDNEIIIGYDLAEAEVIAAGEAFIVGHGKYVDHGKAGAQHFEGIIVGVIVDYIYLFICI